MAGLVDAIMGAPSPDPAGLSADDRAQVGYGGLSQIGALLMAAAQPQYGAQRAQMLAQLGNVPGAMQKATTQAIQQKRLGQQLETEKTAAAATQQVRDLGQSADMSNLNPQQQALMKAAYLSGDPTKVIAAQKDISDMQKPIAGAGGNIIVRKPDGGFFVTNPLTNMRLEIGPDGKPISQPTYISGKPVEESDLQLNPETGTADAWLAKQDMDPGMKARIQRIARGDEQFPGTRDPARTAILNALATYSPNVREQDYKAKQAMITSATSGPLFQKVIRPAQTFANHAAALTSTTDALGLQDDMLGNYIVNPAKLTLMRNSGGDDAAKAHKFDEERTAVTNEFYKFMAGNGQLTDAARKEGEGLKNARTPGAIKGHLDAMVELMREQIAPVANQWAQSMKKPSGSEMLPPETRAALDKVMKWRSAPPESAPGNQTSAAPAAPPAVDPALLAEAKRRGLIK